MNCKYILYIHDNLCHSSGSEKMINCNLFINQSNLKPLQNLIPALCRYIWKYSVSIFDEHSYWYCTSNSSMSEIFFERCAAMYLVEAKIKYIYRLLLASAHLQVSRLVKKLKVITCLQKIQPKLLVYLK